MSLLGRLVVPAPVQAGLDVVTGIVKSIPPLLWYAIAAVALGWWLHSDGDRGGYARAKAEDAASQSLGIEAIRNQAKDREDQQAADFALIAAQLEKENSDALAKADRLIADLRTGAKQLRQRFKCPARPVVLPEAPGGTSGSDATGAGGLSDADAEFLIRFAGQADAVVRQLTACQNLQPKGQP